MPAKKETKSEEKVKKAPAKAKVPKKSALEKLKEKAKALEKEVETLEAPKTEELKKEVKGEEPEEKKDALVPIEDYLKSSIHLGTKVITPDMKSYVYKRRADGLAVFNTSLLDDKIKESAEFLSKFSPQDTIIICKREAGWKPVSLFSKITGIKTFTKKYPPGILTNPELEDFMESELVFICDPWLDKNALNDANKIKIPVLSICDTNNYTQGVSQILPGNNKSAKSLGMIFYLLATIYVEKQKLDVPVPPIEEWIDDWENLVPPK
tara:strand:- start:2017 stop:2814 length:798 start_codon:yes stop_codon:yes gene_type:complete